VTGTNANAVTTFRTKEAAPYWEGLELGLVRYQHCVVCNQAVFYPRTFCPYCMTEDRLEWRTASGRGKLYAFSELFVPPTLADRDRVPYVLGIVEMDEGFFLFGEIATDGRPLEIGAATRAVVIRRHGAAQLNFSVSD
jgi:uncharacterized OB-fold protein